MSRRVDLKMCDYLGTASCAGCGECLSPSDRSSVPLYSDIQSSAESVPRYRICAQCAKTVGLKNLYELRLMNQNIRAKNRDVVRVNGLCDPRDGEKSILDLLPKGTLLIISGERPIHDINYIIGEDTRNLRDMRIFSNISIRDGNPRGIIVTNDEEITYVKGSHSHTRTVSEYVMMATEMNRVGDYGCLTYSKLVYRVSEIIGEILDNISIDIYEHLFYGYAIVGDFLFWAIEYAVTNMMPDWKYEEIKLCAWDVPRSCQDEDFMDQGHSLTYDTPNDGRIVIIPNAGEGWIENITYQQSMPQDRLYYYNDKIMEPPYTSRSDIINSILTRSIYCIRELPIDRERVALLRSRGYRVNTGIDHLDSITPTVERVCALLFLDPEYRCILLVSILVEHLEEIRDIRKGNNEDYLPWK